MNITLGVTGSISAYKSIEILRLLVKDGHEVKVVLTKGALKFVKGELFSYLGATDVFAPNDDFSFPHKSKSPLSGRVLHVELAKWSDKLVIAPLSANTLSNFVSASAEDLLSSLFLAWPKEKSILAFPAMNTQMYRHSFVQENIRKLSELKNVFVSPTQSGELACGDTGEGKLLEVEKVFNLILSLNTVVKTEKRKTILMSTGATVAPLDGVRYLTNASSGKTSLPFITEALKRGHKVVIISGFYATKSLELFCDHPNFTLMRVKTTQQMLEEVSRFFSSCDTYISMAAIGDIQFEANHQKLKKSQFTSNISVSQAPDILKLMLAKKQDHQIVVGFAAETQLTDEVLIEKITRKPVDMLIGTEVSSGLLDDSQAKGFGTDSALYRIVDADHNLASPITMTKKQLARTVAQLHF